MSVFTVESLPAAYGDALWIEYGDDGDRHHVLVDGGLVGTFRHVKRKVQALEPPRRLELMMVTHVDEDHIAGAVKLLGAVEDLGLDFDDVWFNGRDHLDGRQVVLDALGSKQGEFLAALISKRTMHWNRAFDGWPVEVPANGPLPRKTLPGGMRLTLLSPGRAQLSAMVETWDDELKAAELGIDWTDVEEVLAVLRKHRTLKALDTLGGSRDVDALAEVAFSSDTAEANGTSIAVLAEFASRSVLLGADAHAPVLEASIRRLLVERGIERLPLHLLKVPHHGSAANISIDLLKTIACRDYLVSTSGKRFEHPDREAIARIILHGGVFPNLHFNYRSAFSGFWDDEEMGQGIDYQALYPPQGREGCLLDVMALGT
jgi:hypothetical protein